LVVLPFTQVIVVFLDVAKDSEGVGVGVGVGEEVNTYLNAASTNSMFALGNPCVALQTT
jgi:hypothetical protein